MLRGVIGRLHQCTSERFPCTYCLRHQGVRVVISGTTPGWPTIVSGPEVRDKRCWRRQGSGAPPAGLAPRGWWSRLTLRQQRWEELSKLAKSFNINHPEDLEAVRKPLRTVVARSSSILAVMKLRMTAWREPVQHKMYITNLDHCSA